MTVESTGNSNSLRDCLKTVKKEVSCRHKIHNCKSLNPHILAARGANPKEHFKYIAQISRRSLRTTRQASVVPLLVFQ